jgi:hypothetical protein
MLTPEDHERAAVKAYLWEQVFERFHGTFAEFLVLFDNITAYQMAEVMDPQARGWREGTSQQKRLMQYEAAAGICWERRRACAERHEPVPDWVLEAEAEIEAHHRGLLAEDNALRLAVMAAGPVPPGEPVH